MLGDWIKKDIKHQATNPYDNSETFLNEVTGLVDLNHEYMVKILDAGIYTPSRNKAIKIPYIVSEYIEGYSFKEIIDICNNKKEDAKKIISIEKMYKIINDEDILFSFISKLVSIYSYIREKGYVHRDIAPKNIFIDKTLELKLGDFGACLNLQSKREDILIVGSRNYMIDELKNIMLDEFGRFKNARIAYNEDVKNKLIINDNYALLKTIKEICDQYKGNRGWFIALKESINEMYRKSKYKDDLFVKELKAKIRLLNPESRNIANIEGLYESETRNYLIPITGCRVGKRVKKIIQQRAFNRLINIRQITTVRPAFPGGVHTRFEHSLGAYEIMRRYINSLLSNSAMLKSFTLKNIDLMLCSSLLSSIYYCHYYHVFYEFMRRSYDINKTIDVNPSILLNIIDKEYNIIEEASDIFNIEKKSLEKIITNKGRRGEFHSESIDSADNILVSSFLFSTIGVRSVDWVLRDSYHLGLSKSEVFDILEIIPFLDICSSKISVRQEGVAAAERIVHLKYWLYRRIYWNVINRKLIALIRHRICDILEKHKEDIYNKWEEVLRNALFCRESEFIEKINNGRNIEDDVFNYKTILDTAIADIGDDDLAEKLEKLTVKDIYDISCSISKYYYANNGCIVLDITFPDIYTTGEDVMVNTVDGGNRKLVDYSKVVEGFRVNIKRQMYRVRVYAYEEERNRIIRKHKSPEHLKREVVEALKDCLNERKNIL